MTFIAFVISGKKKNGYSTGNMRHRPNKKYIIKKYEMGG